MPNGHHFLHDSTSVSGFLKQIDWIDSRWREEFNRAACRAIPMADVLGAFGGRDLPSVQVRFQPEHNERNAFGEPASFGFLVPDERANEIPALSHQAINDSVLYRVKDRYAEVRDRQQLHSGDTQETAGSLSFDGLDLGGHEEVDGFVGIRKLCLVV